MLHWMNLLAGQFRDEPSLGQIIFIVILCLICFFAVYFTPYYIFVIRRRRKSGERKERRLKVSSRPADKGSQLMKPGRTGILRSFLGKMHNLLEHNSLDNKKRSTNIRTAKRPLTSKYLTALGVFGALTVIGSFFGSGLAIFFLILGGLYGAYLMFRWFQTEPAKRSQFTYDRKTIVAACVVGGLLLFRGCIGSTSVGNAIAPGFGILLMLLVGCVGLIFACRGILKRLTGVSKKPEEAVTTEDPTEICLYQKSRQGKGRYDPLWLDLCSGSGWLPVSDHLVRVLPYVIPIDDFFNFEMSTIDRIALEAIKNPVNRQNAQLAHWNSVWSKASANVRTFLYNQWAEERYAESFNPDGCCCFHIIPPVNSGVAYKQMEHFWTSLKGIHHRISFEIIANGDEDTIVFQLICHQEDKNLIAGLLQSIFENVNPAGNDKDYLIDQIGGNDWRDLDDFNRMGVSLGLHSHYSQPLNICSNFTSGDPLSSLIVTMSSFLESGQGVIVQALVQPSNGSWEDRLNVLPEIDRELCPGIEYTNPSAKLKSALFGVSLKEMFFSREDVGDEGARAAIRKISESFLVFETGDNMLRLNSSCGDDSEAPGIFKHIDGVLSLEEMEAILTRNTYRHGFILNAQELASICHFPSKSLQHPKLLREETGIAKAPDSFVAGQLEALENPPFITPQDEGAEEAWAELPNTELSHGSTEVDGKIPVRSSDGIIIGVNQVHQEKNLIYIPDDFRFRHIYVVGKTGTGKTTLLLNMIKSDIDAGKGVGLIDPHGDLVDKVLQVIPERRVDDVILFDPTDYDYPIGFNMFQVADRTERRQMRSDIVVAIRRLFEGSSWGENIDHLFRESVAALLADTGQVHTLLDVRKLISDDVFRSQVLRRIEDEYIREFWTEDFPSFTRSTISAVKRRLASVLGEPEVRNILGQSQTSFNFREMMDTRRIFLANLSRGKLGEDISGLLGGLLVSKVQLTAMARASQPEEERMPFYLYVDEFQNFVNESFGIILSEARKYKLCLTIAHQFTGQLPSKLYDAVFGNVGTLIVFEVGVDDATALEKQLGKFSRDDIINLERFHTYTRIGKARDSFSMVTLPPPEVERGYSDRIRQASREKYCAWRETGAGEEERGEQAVELPLADDFLESTDELEAKQQDTGEQGAGEPDASTPKEPKDEIRFLE